MRILVTKSNPTPAGKFNFAVSGLRFPSWQIAITLVLVTVALYWPAMRCDFINYDDPDYVTANFHVLGGLSWENVKWAFSNTEQAAYWAPLMWLSHMLDCQIFGLNPWGHHLVNVLLHAANTALAFLVFQRMTGATWRSLMLAALFGMHPLRVESVAWITERKDVLSTLFWLLTMWAYVRYVETARERNTKCKFWYAATLMMFVCGLMSKAMLVTLPCVLLLLDYWPLRRISDFRFPISGLKHLLLEKIPFFALAAAASVVTFVVQKQGGAVVAADMLPFEARVGNALISYFRYLGKMFWPVDMAVFYPHPGHWPLMEVLLAGALLCGISGLLFMTRKRHPHLLMGWLWFVGTLVPVIQLVQSGGQAMADRFTYVPSLGVLIMVIGGMYELTRSWRFQKVVFAATGSAVIILCLALTREQLTYWQDSETLFRHALKVTENNYIAHKALGDALNDRGQTDEAIFQYQEAIRINPDFADAHINFGNALLKKGQTNEAISEFQTAIRLRPKDAIARIDIGNVLLKKGQADGAISQYQEAIQLKPDYADAHYNLGLALFRKGQIDEAIDQYQQVILSRPDDADARASLGIALVKKGKIREAISQYQEAIRLKPDYADAHFNLGNALVNQGQTAGAIRQYQEVIRINPNDTDARINLGAVLFNQGQPDAAIRQFQEVVRLKPDDAAAQNNLAEALRLKNESNAQAPGPAKP
jgi:tetratricopeptide (TPR) repeat protein